MNRAAIDIGSNSFLLTVVDADGRVLHDEARVVGMSKGLGELGTMQPERREHARAVLGDYVRIAAGHDVDAGAIRAVATSGARRALDAGELFEQVRDATGLQVRTISGLEEARLSYAGAAAGKTGPLVLIDLGGGSTEVARGIGETLVDSCSLEMGAVRLTEAFGLGGQRPDLASCRLHVRTLAGDLAKASDAQVLLVAGTATTLAAISLGLDSYDGERVHDSELTVPELRRLAALFETASPEERRRIAHVSPKRAEYLLAGATVLVEVLGALETASARVSDRGLRFGLLSGLT